jgi:predicted NBD/HSP70 family sugar kinase
VRGGKPIAEPVNLGDGWVGFDYEAAFGVPTKVVNDAVLQAIGSYDGGRMLFLGLGTGLGSALIRGRRRRAARARTSPVSEEDVRGLRLRRRPRA